MATVGNLVLIDEDGADMRAKASMQPKRVAFQREHAEMVMHFYKDKFQQIAEMNGVKVTRNPKQGDIEELTFEFDKSDRKVDESISDLYDDIRTLDIRDVVGGILQDKSRKVDEFIMKNTRLDILMIPEPGQVTVIGRNYEDVKKIVHRLKVEIGQIQPNSRGHRGSADVVEDSGTSSSRRIDGSRSFTGSPSSSQRLEDTRRMSGSSAYSASSGESDFNFTADIGDGFTLKIYKANITRVKVDVIVNAANESLMHGGGVARVIADAAGYELDQESKDYIDEHGSLEPGENCITTAGRLKDQYQGVIHAVGPVWYSYRDKVECLDVLYDCIWNILKTCNKRNYRSVAMSAISSGIFGVPKELCADMYVAAVTGYAAKKSKGKFVNPEALHIIDIDLKILALVKTSYEKWKKNPDSVKPKESFEQYKRDNPHFQGSYTSSYTGDSRSNAPRGRRSRGHGQNASSGGVSDVKSEMNDKCTFSKLGNEIFRWGGEAQVYLVGKKITVKVFKGEVDKTKRMDAIVCGIDLALKGRGFIADTLKKAGGPEYRSNFEKMVNSRRSLAKLSDVYRCGGGDLGVREVMFIVSNRMTYVDEKELKTYQDAIHNVLQNASAWKLRKIVLPMFGTGQIQTNRASLTKCVKVLVKALDNFVSTCSNNELQEIHLANNNELVNEVLCEVFDDVTSKRSVHNQDKQRKYGRYNEGSSSPRGRGNTESSMDNSYRGGHGNIFHKNHEPSGSSYNKTRDTNNVDEDKRGGGSDDRRHGGSMKSSIHMSDRDREYGSGLGARLEDDEDDSVANAAGSSTTEKPKPKGNLMIIEV